MNIKFIFVLFVSLLLLISCQRPEEAVEQAPPDRSPSLEDEASIREVMTKMVESWNAADLEGVMACFAKDAIHMPPGEAAVSDKQEVRNIWQKFFEEYTTKWEHTIEYIEISGILAFVRGSSKGEWSKKDGSESGSSNDKTIYILRRGADGTWKVVVEIWNANETAE